MLQSFEDLLSIIYNFDFKKSKNLWNYCSTRAKNIDNKMKYLCPY